jgi:hypothetical protein
MSTPVPNPVSVTFNLKFWDFFVASLIAIRYSGALMIVHAIFPLAGLSLIVVSSRGGHRFGPDEVILIVLAFSFTPLVTAVAVWAGRRGNKTGQGPFTYSFDAEGMHSSSSTFDLAIKWPAIRRVRQSKRFLFIFIAPSRAYCIPLKALIEQGVLEEVRSIAGQHTDLR